MWPQPGNLSLLLHEETIHLSLWGEASLPTQSTRRSQSTQEADDGGEAGTLLEGGLGQDISVRSGKAGPVLEPVSLMRGMLAFSPAVQEADAFQDQV